MKKYKLGELIEINNGTRYSHLQEGDIPLYGSGGLMSYVNDYLYDGKAILLPRKGTLTNIMYTEGKIWTVDTMYYAKVNEKANAYYLYSYLSLLNLAHLDSGSALPSMTRWAYNNIEVVLPSLKTQNEIADLLQSFDAKIELNNKINQELEAMAKTLYDYWFVQFDFPNEDGQPYKSSGGKMVYNEELKREIPKGWENGVLSDIADITMGQSPAGNSYNEEGIGVVFYQGSTDFGARFPTVRMYTTKPKRMAKEGDILLSVRAPVGTLNQAMEDCCIGRGLAALRETEGSNSFLFSQLAYFKQIFDRRNASGTTFGSINRGDLFGLKLCIPDKKVLENFKEIVDPLHEMIVVNSKQNIELAELRDWLLPMLMNGQVTVGDGYAAKEEVLGMVAEDGVHYNKTL